MNNKEIRDIWLVLGAVAILLIVFMVAATYRIDTLDTRVTELEQAIEHIELVTDKAVDAVERYEGARNE